MNIPSCAFDLSHLFMCGCHYCSYLQLGMLMHVQGMCTLSKSSYINKINTAM